MEVSEDFWPFDGGTLELTGALSGTGKDQIGDATLEMSAAVAATQTFVYTASGGALALDDFTPAGAQSFHGKISGFGAGDKIDIGAPFGAGTVPVFAENTGSTGGTLTLTDGSLQAAIDFIGSYSTSNFMPASDGHGGTLLTSRS